MGGSATRGADDGDLVDVEIADSGVALYSRGRFVRVLAAVGAGAAVPWGIEAATAAAASAPSPRQDRQILNFALLLEELKRDFYADALARGALSGETERFARVAGGHERDHAAFLRRLLGSHAQPARTFRFGSLLQSRTRFVRAATELEELAVAAYNGQAANLSRRPMGAVFEIVSVEGRHAAWVRALADEEPAPRAADPGADAAAVTAALRRLHIR